MQDVSAYLYDLFPSSCSTSMLSAHCGKKTCASGCPYPVEGLKFGSSFRSEDIYLGVYGASP